MNAKHARRIGSALVLAIIGTIGSTAIAGAAAESVELTGGGIPVTMSDSADVVAVAARFHAALAAGDSAGALALLAPDVAILESGGTETLADYRAHHLSADIEYARAVPSVRTVTSVRVLGDAAWVSATSTTQGEFRGRPVNSAGAELMVLSRSRGNWTIRAIHWSSRRRTP